MLADVKSFLFLHFTGLFTCSNDQQIPDDFQCDGSKDCANNSDELGNHVLYSCLIYSFEGTAALKACFSFLFLISVCYKGDIHVTGTGSTSSQGNVELCIHNQYYPICGNVWTSTEATVACRHLASEYD